MPKVFVPAQMRDLTGGLAVVETPGQTVRQALQHLEAQYPGVWARLVEDDRIKPSVAVVVDGHVSTLRLRQKVSADSEIHFLPAISGG